MTDFLEVKAKRTFDNGSGLKTRRSPAFPVDAIEARLLEAHGYVEIVGEAEVANAPAGKATTDDEIPVTDATEAETTVVEPAPAKRGRKAKADAID